MASKSSRSGPARPDRSTECAADGGNPRHVASFNRQTLLRARLQGYPHSPGAVRPERRAPKPGRTPEPVFGCSKAAAWQLPVSCLSTGSGQQQHREPAASRQQGCSKRTASPQQADSKRPATTCHTRVHQRPPCLERRRPRRRHRIQTSTAKKPPDGASGREHPDGVSPLIAMSDVHPVAVCGYLLVTDPAISGLTPSPAPDAENTLDHVCVFSRPAGLKNQATPTKAFGRKEAQRG